MALGEVARCFKCKVYASGEELQLNRQHWEYECRDGYACSQRITNMDEAIRQAVYNRTRQRKRHERRLA